MNILKNWLKSMQKFKMSWSHFIAIHWGTGILSKSPQKTLHPLLPLNLYHNCNSCPLSVFITCCCDHDYSGLVKYGRAKDKDIQKAWELIYSEYSDTSGNPTSKYLIDLSKDICWHDAKLRAVALCLKVLQHAPDARCINVLKGYGYNYTFDITNPEEYAKSLDIIATRLQSVVFLIQQKKVEFERESKKVSGKPMTRASFYTTIAVVTAHMKFRIDPIETTVTEFIEYRKLYEREMEAIARAGKPERVSVKGTSLRNV